MRTLTLTIDGQPLVCPDGKTILDAADAAEIYIPRLCYHSDLPPVSEMTWAAMVCQGTTGINGEKPGIKAGEEAHCNLCLVEIKGQSQPVNSCKAYVEDGMVIRTDAPEVIRQRKLTIGKLLADHPHACLTCAQKEGCSRSDCSSNVPVEERCCLLLGHCELEKICRHIGIPGDIAKYVPQQRPIITDDPLFDRDFNLCIGCLRCVRACRDLRGADVLGAVWKNGRTWIGTRRGAGLKEAECRFCGACVEVCPTGALRDKERALVVRRDTPVPCVSHCPAGIDIPRYLRLIARSHDREALELIRLRVPFPGILGYVCFHPCESTCRRGDLDQPVAICALKRFVADSVSGEDDPPPVRAPDTGKKIAIIGSGPTGMTAAFFLQRLGHQVELFDEGETPGGMLRYGIPDYRLPPEVLDRELKVLEKMGIRFHMSCRFGDDGGIDKVKSQSFDAILIATGTSASKTLPIQGADLEGILPGLEFLRSAKLSRQPRLSGQVVIIGGGNVAIDAAMTALRLGAGSVHLVCLESRDEMPARSWEIAQAEEEGIQIHSSWGPKRFVGRNSKVSAVELVKCTRILDERGRFAPAYDENETRCIPADSIIIAIGQRVDPRLFNQLGSSSESPAELLKVDEHLSVGVDGVFAAGDVVQGPTSVVRAIAEGRRAADTIDRYLSGQGLSDLASESPDADDPKLGISSEIFQLSRQIVATADPQQRTTGFDLIEETLGEQPARIEAQRCLQCHLRQLITAVILPPERWQPLNDEAVSTVPNIEGVFQLLDAGKNIIRISGTPHLRQDISKYLGNPGDAKFFIWEEDPMYTKRESELIQHYLQKYGEMPGGSGGDDDLNDLF